MKKPHVQPCLPLSGLCLLLFNRSGSEGATAAEAQLSSGRVSFPSPTSRHSTGGGYGQLSEPKQDFLNASNYLH
jgi:hypothetical protein